MSPADEYSRGALPLRFGRFELQADERRLLVDGAPAALGGRAFDLLLALAERPGQLSASTC
jgi:DNA-binding winged helix-turn-helix (wHTH) protein